MPPSSVIPAPLGLKFLRVWPPEPKDVANRDQWYTDLQPVLALVVDPDNLGMPPEVVTATGDTFSRARDDESFALVLDDGAVVDAGGDRSESVDEFVEACRRHAVRHAARASGAARAAEAAARAVEGLVAAKAPNPLDYEKDVMAPMVVLAAAKGRPTVEPIFAAFKVKNAAGLKPEQWPAVIAAVAEIAADESIPLLKAAETM